METEDSRHLLWKSRQLTGGVGWGDDPYREAPPQPSLRLGEHEQDAA